MRAATLRCELTLPRITASAAVLAVAAGLLQAGPPAAPKVSSFAPAADIQSQVDYYLGRLATALEEEAGYREAEQRRVEKDAHTLVTLLLALGLHDDENRLKPAAPALVPAALSLANAASEYAQARSALEKLNGAIEKGSGTGEALTWQPAASLPQLMKQVPTINNRLRRSVQKRSFERDADKSVGYTAALAVIAQASIADTSAVKSPADEAKWYEFCADMRDAAGAANAAIHAKDFDATTMAIKRLTQSCDDCHAVFRKEL